MRLTDVKKAYGVHTVLDGLSLEIPDGEITCVLGRSGVGKTTLLNVMAGVASFDGKVDVAPKSVGYVFQENRLIPHLTLRQNLQYVGARVSRNPKTTQKANSASSENIVEKGGSIHSPSFSLCFRYSRRKKDYQSFFLAPVCRETPVFANLRPKNRSFFPINRRVSLRHFATIFLGGTLAAKEVT